MQALKATEQYFPVVLFIMLYKVVLTFSLWMKSCVVAIQFKATEQWFIYANEILKGDFSNESYRQVVPNCIVKFNPFVCERNPMVRPFKKHLIHWRVISDKVKLEQ